MDGEFEQIRVRDLVFFDRLAALGTITAAAREMGVPKPTASRWLAVLEARVGYPLVKRTTRHAALTERGQAFHERVRELLALVRGTRSLMATDEPGGTIRVSVPVPLGRLMGGRVIAGFLRRMPRVRLEIALQNQRVDLVRDRFDLAIRGGELPDSDLVARRLARSPLSLYASAELDGTPRDQLAVIAAPGDEKLLRAGKTGLGRPTVIVDDRGAVADALVAGAGVGVLPAFMGEPAVRRGELVRLSAKPLTHMSVHAIYLPAQRDDPRLRVLIEEVEQMLGETFGG